MVAVANRHGAVIVDHPAWEDQLIVSADEGEQLAAVRLELVNGRERISHVCDVSRTRFGDIRIFLHRDRLPIEGPVVLVPMELGDAEGEWRAAVEAGKGGPAIEPEPDLVALAVARPVPDLIDGLGLSHGETVLRRRIRVAANRLHGAEVARPRVVDDTVFHAVRGIAVIDGRLLDGVKD